MRDYSEYEFKLIIEQIEKNKSYINEKGLSERLKKQIVERNKELCIIANDIKSNIRNTTCECEYFENFYAKYDDINVYEL